MGQQPRGSRYGLGRKQLLHLAQASSRAAKSISDELAAATAATAPAMQELASLTGDMERAASESV